MAALDQENMMQKLLLIGMVLLFGSVTNSTAQVKKVQMHIDGYLCGN